MQEIKDLQRGEIQARPGIGPMKLSFALGPDNLSRYMVSIEAVCRLALSFPETDEYPHFERRAFRVKKKIFATLLEKDKTLNLKLTPVDQSVFCSFDNTIIYPVPGGWGRQGFTTVNLKKVRMSMLKDALTTAYCTVAPPKLAEKFLPR